MEDLTMCIFWIFLGIVYFSGVPFSEAQISQLSSGQYNSDGGTYIESIWSRQRSRRRSTTMAPKTWSRVQQNIINPQMFDSFARTTNPAFGSNSDRRSRARSRSFTDDRTGIHAESSMYRTSAPAIANNGGLPHGVNQKNFNRVTALYAIDPHSPQPWARSRSQSPANRFTKVNRSRFRVLQDGSIVDFGVSSASQRRMRVAPITREIRPAVTPPSTRSRTVAQFTRSSQHTTKTTRLPVIPTINARSTSIQPSLTSQPQPAIQPTLTIQPQPSIQPTSQPKQSIQPSLSGQPSPSVKPTPTSQPYKASQPKVNQVKQSVTSIEKLRPAPIWTGLARGNTGIAIRIPDLVRQTKLPKALHIQIDDGVKKMSGSGVVDDPRSTFEPKTDARTRFYTPSRTRSMTAPMTTPATTRTTTTTVATTTPPPTTTTTTPAPTTTTTRKPRRSVYDGPDGVNITYGDDKHVCPPSRARWHDYTLYLETKPRLCMIQITWDARYKREPIYHNSWWGVEVEWRYKTIYVPSVEVLDMHGRL